MRTFSPKRNDFQKPGPSPGLSNAARSTAVTPRLSSRADLFLPLQQTVGNQAVQRMLQRNAQGRQRLQAKLVVGQPGDVYEQEADRVATTVTRRADPKASEGPVPAAPQVTVTPTNGLTGQREVQRQTGDFDFQVPEEDRLLQAKAVAGQAPEVPPGFDERLDGLEGKGQPLAPPLRTFFEPRFGYDLGPVRVHTGAWAHQLARAVDARAFTLGRHIVFGEGNYAPATPEGRHLLAHELTHTVQQGAVAQRAPSGSEGPGSSSVRTAPAGPLMLQRAACNFYVYDSTEPTLSRVWKWATQGLASKAWGGYSVASADTIEETLHRVLSIYASEDCDCIEEFQFLSHGSPGNAMSITKTNDELTINDFNIPDLDKFGDGPRNTAAYQAWHSKLTPRQRRLVLLRRVLCGPDAEMYYRSCEAFQGKTGHEFAKASAAFWRSKVIGHTKVIALSQPGKKELSPGEQPYWPESEGTEAPTPKKPGKDPDQKPKK